MDKSSISWAQIEDFQKLLWEKHKFVTETQYCITLSNIGAEFYPDIIANEAQWNEWQELFDVDGDDRSDAFLQSHPTLVLEPGTSAPTSPTACWRPSTTWTG